VSDAEAAAAVAEQLRGELSRRVVAAGSFAPVTALMKNSTVTSHEVTTADNAAGAVSDSDRLLLPPPPPRCAPRRQTAVKECVDASFFFEGPRVGLSGEMDGEKR
jgi:hypothetical protein